MKLLTLSEVKGAEEVLISYEGYKFRIATKSQGSYGFEKRVYIDTIDKELERKYLKAVGMLKLFEHDKEKIKEECIRMSSLIIGLTDFDTCLKESKKYKRVR